MRPEGLVAESRCLQEQDLGSRDPMVGSHQLSRDRPSAKGAAQVGSEGSAGGVVLALEMACRLRGREVGRRPLWGEKRCSARSSFRMTFALSISSRIRGYVPLCS